MKKNSLEVTTFILIILFPLFLSGCNYLPSSDVYTNNFSDLDPQVEFINATDKFNEIILPQKRNCEITINEYILPENNQDKNTDYSINIEELTIYENNIYYVVSHMPSQSILADKVEVYRYNILNKHVDLLFDYDKGDGVTWLNEIRVNKKNLFWVLSYFYIDEPYKVYKDICKMNLDDNSINIIKTFNEEDLLNEICLSLTDSYLSWYEAREENGNPKCYLIIYDLEKDIIKNIHNDCFIWSPFVRAHIRNNNVSFLTRDSVHTYLNIINLESEEKSEILFPVKSDLRNIISNDIFTVWFGQQHNNIVYIYNHAKENYYYIELKENRSIFYIDLYKNF